MVEPIAHYLIPTLILLAFLPRVDRKLILKLSPLAIIPDFDFFIGHLYLFHNLIFAVGIPALVYIYSKNRQASLIAFYFLGSHLLLDTFGPGVGFSIRSMTASSGLIFTCTPPLLLVLFPMRPGA